MERIWCVGDSGPAPWACLDFACSAADHGVNNAEGALRWPGAMYRVNGSRADGEAALALVLRMLESRQGQVQSLFCADEVFCGRDPNRGTETCAVVEAMASLEQARVRLGVGGGG